MEARTTWLRPNASYRILVVGIIAGSLFCFSPVSLNRTANAQRFGPVARSASNAPRNHRFATTNFVVTAPDPQLARKVGQQAEVYRKELALKWLGYELEPWSDPCPITVELSMHAGGETSFAFVNQRQQFSRVNYDSGSRKNYARPGTPLDWQMKIFGPANRVVDSVLPHEITHTIFATHFGQPLPRWADEGACTTVEHASEREKNHRMLLEFLTTRPSRGIPFNRMFTMKQYPHDILPLYAQGYSLSRFLIAQKGHQYFVDYVGAGLANKNQLPETRHWDQVTKKFYGYENLSDLQLQWQDWVRKGSKTSSLKSSQPSAASISQTQTVLPNLTTSAPSEWVRPKTVDTPPPRSLGAQNQLRLANSWYARQAKGPLPDEQDESVEKHRVVKGVQHKVAEPPNIQRFSPGSTQSSSIMRKPAEEIGGYSRTDRTSDQRHHYQSSASAVWR